MEGTEKKTPFKALVEKGKATGKLTTQDIDAAMIEMNLDVEELDKLYETLEANNIEVVDDISATLSRILTWISRSRSISVRATIRERMWTTPLRSISRR